MVRRRVGFRAAATDVLDLPLPDSGKLCRLDAPHEDMVYAQIWIELNDGF